MSTGVPPVENSVRGSSTDRFRHLSFLTDSKSNAPSPSVRPSSRVARTRASATAPLDAEAAAYFQALCSRWGLQATRYRSSILQRRKGATLRALRAADLRDGIETLDRDAAAAERALAAVMIGVTSFFRDPAVFESLAALIPDLHAQAGRLNVLSVGCSNGVEL